MADALMGTEEERAALSQTEIDMVIGKKKPADQGKEAEKSQDKDQDWYWPDPGSEGTENDSGRPSKWGKKDGGKGAWRPWNSGPKRQWEPSSRGSGSTAQLDPRVQTFLTTMTRAVLRHEADLTLLRADTSFVLFIDISEHSCLQLVKDSAANWQELFTAGQVTIPLKTALMGCIVKTLRDKMETLQTDEEQQGRCRDAGWLKEGRTALDPAWVYHAWDPQAKQQIVAPQQPRSHSELLKDLNTLAKFLPVEGVLLRFRSTKNLQDKLEGEVVPFMATMSLRMQAAHEVHEILCRLSRNACCKLLGMRIKPERGSRSQMSKTIEQAYMNLDFCEWKPRGAQARGST